MKKTALIILFTVLFYTVTKAQQFMVKELDAEISSINNFEQSRLSILELADSITSVITQMQEQKDGSRPRSFSIEFYTDDIGFRIFDEALHRFGHIEKKTSGMELNACEGDTSALKNQIQQNDSAIMQLTDNLMVGDVDFDKINAFRENLKKENEKLYQTLAIMRISVRLPNRINIVLSN